MFRFLAIAALGLAACAPGDMPVDDNASLPVDQAAMPQPLVFEATPLVLTRDATFTVSGAPPNSNVYLGYSLTGAGTGPCPPTLGGCLGIRNPQLIRTVRADATGTAELTLTFPASLPFTSVAMQAAVLTGGGYASNVLVLDILTPDGDFDGDTLTNSDELDLGTSPLLADSDGGGGDDDAEIDVGSDPIGEPGDDVLLTYQTIDATLSVDVDFQGSLAGVACLFGGACDCDATFTASGVRTQQFGTTVQFFGQWEKTADTCNAVVGIDTIVWTDTTGDAYHTVQFSADGSTVEAWVAHADPANFVLAADPFANQQAGVGGISVPVVGGLITYQLVDQQTQQGVDVVATIDVNAGFNQP